MEGVNFAAILLGYLAAFVFGVTSLVAFGLWIGGRNQAARVIFAAGLLSLAVLAALATLSFLQRGHGFNPEGGEPTLVLAALSLLLAGAGQLVAALRDDGRYGPALGCAAGALALLGASVLGGDLFGMPAVPNVLAVRSLSLPWVHLGLALGLLLAVLSVAVATVPARRRAGAVRWTALAALGGIAGFAAGDACVTTRATLIQSMPGGDPCRVRVQVEVLGTRLSDETGWARIPREGLALVRSVSPAQAAWVYGPLALGAAVGGALGAGIAWALGRRTGRPDRRIDAGPEVR